MNIVKTNFLHVITDMRISVFNQPSRPTQPGHPSVCRQMSTGDGTMTAEEESGEFCVRADLLTGTVGILT